MKNLSLMLLIMFVIINYGCETSTESDTTSPDVSISSPVDGATVSDTVTIKALVADNEGVKSVEFYIDGELLSTDTQEPFEVDWITNNSNNGSHTLHCKATDSSDNEALSESITVTVENIILSAAFTENWACAGCEGYLFYSDMSGNILWSGTFSNDEVIEILPTDDIPSFPDRIMVTTILPEIDNNYVSITTNIYVKPESWTWKGNSYWWLNQLGDATLELQNIPDHQGYIVASKWNRRNSGGVISSPHIKSLYSSSDNIYLRINASTDGPKYLWLSNIVLGETRLVDLSNMQMLNTKIVNLPAINNGEEIGFEVRGFFNDDYYSGYYSIDMNWGYTSSTVTSYYPTSLFSKYRTVMYFDEEAYPTNNSWYHMKIGTEIPDEMIKLDSDFEFISTSPTNFEIQITGDYSGTGTRWLANDGINEIAWAVYGPLDSYSLPELPDIFKQTFTGISRQSFTLENANIHYRPELIEYDDLIEMLFQSDDRFYDVYSEDFGRSKDPEGLRP